MLLSLSGWPPVSVTTSHIQLHSSQAPWHCSPSAKSTVFVREGHDTAVHCLCCVSSAAVRLTWAPRGTLRNSALAARRASSSGNPSILNAAADRRLALTLGTAVAVGTLVSASAASARNTYPLDYVCKDAPCHPEEDPVAARIRKEIGFKEPMRSLGQTWDIRQLDQTKRGLQVFYPPWLAGRWAVRSKYLGAQLPLGQKFIGPTVPGARKGSVILVADIGYDPAEAYEQRFYVSDLEGGVVADRAFNAASCLKAYWPESEVTKASYDPAANTTRFSLSYTTPSRKKSLEGIGGVVTAERVKRAVEMYVNNRENAYETPDSFCCSELYRQAALETARSYDYQTNLALQRSSDTEVLAKYTVGAFLNPQDELYFQAGDKAVAVYAYSQRWTRIPETSALTTK